MKIFIFFKKRETYINYQSNHHVTYFTSKVANVVAVSLDDHVSKYVDMIVDMHDAVLALWGPAMWRFTKCLRFVSEVFLEGLSCSFSWHGEGEN